MGSPSERWRSKLSKERVRELTIDTMASWALEGLVPDRETVEDINRFLADEMTLKEFIEKSKRIYGTD